MVQRHLKGLNTKRIDMLLTGHVAYRTTVLTHCFFIIRVLWAIITSSLLGRGLSAIFLGMQAVTGVLSSSSVASFFFKKTASIKSCTNKNDFPVFTGFATHFFCPFGKTNLYFFSPLFFPLSLWPDFFQCWNCDQSQPIEFWKPRLCKKNEDA